jgi:hypothetical protein
MTAPGTSPETIGDTMEEPAPVSQQEPSSQATAAVEKLARCLRPLSAVRILAQTPGLGELIGGSYDSQALACVYSDGASLLWRLQASPRPRAG